LKAPDHIPPEEYETPCACWTIDLDVGIFPIGQVLSPECTWGCNGIEILLKREQWPRDLRKAWGLGRSTSPCYARFPLIMFEKLLINCTRLSCIAFINQFYLNKEKFKQIIILGEIW